MSRKFWQKSPPKTTKIFFYDTPMKPVILLIIILILSLLCACTVPASELEPEIDPLAPLPFGHFVWLLMKQVDPGLRFSDPIPDAMAAAAERGFIPTSKEPDALITREEVAHILMKATPPTGSITPEHFQWQIFDLSDADACNRNTLLEAYANGLLTATDGRIQPKDPLYIDDAQSILARLNEPDQRILPPDLPTPYFEYNGLVEVIALDPSIVIDLKYATADNFTGVVHYNQSLCLLEADTAQKLVAANRFFQVEGYTIKIWDGYRPVAVQWSLYHATPDHLKAYVPAPSKYSQHAKGIAADITLVDGNLQEITMPTGFDDFSEKAHSRYSNLSQSVLTHRDDLIAGMQAHGFRVSELEWWHFYNPEKSSLSISDVELDEFIHARNQFYLDIIQNHS